MGRSLPHALRYSISFILQKRHGHMMWTTTPTLADLLTWWHSRRTGVHIVDHILAFIKSESLSTSREGRLGSVLTVDRVPKTCFIVGRDSGSCSTQQSANLKTAATSSATSVVGSDGRWSNTYFTSVFFGDEGNDRTETSPSPCPPISNSSVTTPKL